ncbi:Isochorismatase-like [Teratosphaeria destructans]|uniref:Isochorismatase-like n=1 Tax=Teratosphaeria destructans TaxID=418781 RepID=A0A9W7SKH4_9PEZI|nr:Isochorismatase-like [Teratosphaeria destructans]
MATDSTTKHDRAVIGTRKNFWLYSSRTGFDLTHPPTPTSPPISPNVTIKTTTSPITIDPAKSALVIIDMQNFFLSEAFGRAKGAGHAALEQLTQYGIPAARKAGIRIVWLNWGLSGADLEDMPPAVSRAFGFEVVDEEAEGSADAAAADKHGVASVPVEVAERRRGKKYAGLGSDCGILTDPQTGQDIDAGRLLVRDAWNSALYPPLDRIYAEGAALSHGPDVWIHKNRMSGMWGAKSACEEFLEKEGIKTLFFSGVNTDQCVGGSLTDAFSKGYDCVLLSDGAATTSPEHAQLCFEFNAAETYGFLTSCRDFAEGVEGMA